MHRRALEVEVAQDTGVGCPGICCTEVQEQYPIGLQILVIQEKNPVNRGPIQYHIGQIMVVQERHPVIWYTVVQELHPTIQVWVTQERHPVTHYVVVHQ